MKSKCKTCQVREFVHRDLYCQECPDKPKPDKKYGVAYLMSRYGGNAIISAEVEAPAGKEYEMSAVELMRKCKIEFHESDSRKLTETILKEFQ